MNQSATSNQVHVDTNPSCKQAKCIRATNTSKQAWKVLLIETSIVLLIETSKEGRKLKGSKQASIVDRNKQASSFFSKCYY